MEDDNDDRDADNANNGNGNDGGDDESEEDTVQEEEEEEEDEEQEDEEQEKDEEDGDDDDEEELEALRDLSDGSDKDAEQELDQASLREKQAGRSEESGSEAAGDTAVGEEKVEEEEQTTSSPASPNVVGDDPPSERRMQRKRPRVLSGSDGEGLAGASVAASEAAADTSTNNIGDNTSKTDGGTAVQQQGQDGRRQGRRKEENVPAVVALADDDTENDAREQPQIEEAEADEASRQLGDNLDAAVVNNDTAPSNEDTDAGDGNAIVSEEDGGGCDSVGLRCGDIVTDSATHDRTRHEGATPAAENCVEGDGVKCGAPDDDDAPAGDAEATNPVHGGAGGFPPRPSPSLGAHENNAEDLAPVREKTATVECLWRPITLPSPPPSACTAGGSPTERVAPLDPLLVGEKGGLALAPGTGMETLESPQDTALLRRKADRDPRGK